MAECLGQTPNAQPRGQLAEGGSALKNGGEYRAKFELEAIGLK